MLTHVGLHELALDFFVILGSQLKFNIHCLKLISLIVVTMTTAKLTT